MTVNYPVSRTDDLVIQELKDEVLIYGLKINKALCLNQTSALIWNLCDGKSSISEIRRQVTRKLKSPVSEEIIWLALEELSRQNLLVKDITAKHLYQEVSRREAVRRIGIASAVSLPLISSITAPLAVHAQSLCGTEFGRPEGCPCTNGDQCETGICRTDIDNTCGLGDIIPCPCQRFCLLGGECACDENGVPRDCPVECSDCE